MSCLSRSEIRFNSASRSASALADGDVDDEKVLFKDPSHDGVSPVFPFDFSAGFEGICHVVLSCSSPAVARALLLTALSLALW